MTSQVIGLIELDGERLPANATAGRLSGHRLLGSRDGESIASVDQVVVDQRQLEADLEVELRQFILRLVGREGRKPEGNGRK